MVTRRASLVAIQAMVLPAWCGSARSDQPYPSRPISIVVPQAAGGASDVTARAVAERMRSALGQPFVVENRAGATGDIGIRSVAVSQPDGYTLVQVSAANTANQSARPARAYPISEQLRPIGRTGISAFSLVVPKSLGIATLADFIGHAKARPGQLAYASIGYGSSQHLVMEMFCAAAGLSLNHVPYRGETAATPDLMAGRVQAMFMAGAKTLLPGGSVVALGTTNRTPWPSLPDLPPLGTLPGLREFHYNGWNGLMAPLKTPDAIVNKVSHALVAALREDSMLATLRTIGFEPGPGTPQDMAEQIRTDLVNFKRIISERHLTFPD